MQYGRSQDENIEKYLRTRHRLVFANGIYHVTQRAPGQERLFLEDRDYLKFIVLLKSISEEFQLKIFSFSLLPNHLHLLFQLKEKNISQAMKSLFEQYAKYLNFKYNRKGHVFSGPFRASVIDDNHYFMAACLYIHLNAFRAGLCDLSLRYRWHSLNVYLEGTRTASFVDSGTILGLFDNDREKARKKYRSLLDHGVALKEASNTRPSSVQNFIKKTSLLVKEALGGPIIQNNTPKGAMARFFLKKGFSGPETAMKLGISRATLYRILSVSDKQK